jgi:hypothetical protein
MNPEIWAVIGLLDFFFPNQNTERSRRLNTWAWSNSVLNAGSKTDW